MSMHIESSWDDEPQEEQVVPLTRAEAENLFGTQISRPSRVTPLRVIAAQMVVSLIALLIALAYSSHPQQAALSALLGGAISWAPSAIFALLLKKWHGQASVIALVVGEIVKLVMTFIMFGIIALGYPSVLWLPLLLTYVAALKTYWVALALY
jgi:ATP synthase protein I